MYHATTVIAVALLAWAAVSQAMAYESGGGSYAAMRVSLIFDLLPDSSDITLSTGLGTTELEGHDWDDAWRLGVDFTGQYMLSEGGGPYLAYGLGLFYNRYEVTDGGSEFSGNGYMLQPHIGLGMHAAEWLFLSANVYGEVGLATFDFKSSTFPGGIDESSYNEFIYGYGIYAAADFALGETIVFGARAGWMQQELEGTFDDADLTVESTTDGFFVGALFGVRF